MNIRFQLVVLDTKYRRIFYFYTTRGLACETIIYGLRHGHYLPLFNCRDMLVKHPDWFIIGLEDVRGLGLVGASTEDYAAVHWYDPHSSHGSFDVYGEYYGDFRGGRFLDEYWAPKY